MVSLESQSARAGCKINFGVGYRIILSHASEAEFPARPPLLQPTSVTNENHVYLKGTSYIWGIGDLT